MAAPPAPSSSGSSNATTILVLGIVSIFCTILGPVALIMANNALKTADPSQVGTINAGRICGIVGTVFLCLGILYWILSITVLGGLLHHAATMPTAPTSP